MKLYEELSGPLRPRPRDAAPSEEDCRNEKDPGAAARAARSQLPAYERAARRLGYAARRHLRPHWRDMADLLAAARRSGRPSGSLGSRGSKETTRATTGECGGGPLDGEPPKFKFVVIEVATPAPRVESSFEHGCGGLQGYMNYDGLPNSSLLKLDLPRQFSPRRVSSTVPCKYFGSAKGCALGDGCAYMHGNPNTVPQCRMFASPGGCKHGDGCFFRHVSMDEADSEVLGAAVPPQRFSVPAVIPTGQGRPPTSRGCGWPQQFRRPPQRSRRCQPRRWASPTRRGRPCRRGDGAEGGSRGDHSRG